MGTKTLLTLEEFERLPQDEGVWHELDEGELVTVTYPLPRHGRVERKILEALILFLHEHPLGEVLTADTRYLLSREPPTVRAPDVSFIRTERAVKIDPDQRIEGAPDLAVEIVSPSDTAAALLRKTSQYLAAGAQAVWVVYKQTQEVHVFESNGKVRRLLADDVLEAPELLPGFAVKVGTLFA